MQVLLHADPHVDGRHQMADHLESVVNAALARFVGRVTRVEAHLSDADGRARAEAGAIHCTLEARLTGLASVVVKEHADNAHQAIEGAVRKLKRAIGDEIAKHDPRRHHAQAAAPARDDADEAPD